MEGNPVENPIVSGEENQPIAKSDGFPHGIEHSLDILLAAILFAELAVLFGNIVIREMFSRAFVWAEEVAGLALAAVTFIGGAVAYYEGKHLSVRMIVNRFPPRLRNLADALGNWVVMALSVVCLVLMCPNVVKNWNVLTTSLQISKSWIYIPYMFGMLLLILFATKRLSVHSVRTIIASCGIMIVFLVSLYFIQGITGPWTGPGGFLFAGIILLGIIALGVPIGFCLPAVAFLYLMASKMAGVAAIPTAMTSGVSGFIMLAIPFFILAGDLMTMGGLTKPLADWVCSLVGHLRGGLMQVLVITVFIFSGISGSKVADIAAVGTTMRKMLKENGYEPAEFSAVLAGSAIMGETIPPAYRYF